ncbi:MAG: hypothetical protein CML04_03520 [Pseudozobellia sp.]|nr:hypothetical protein [Pseudozobellia sp.]MBG49215.1 hypothetical protein [Pseudozobellia sp.]|tara:strand:+ start:1448117 stop:1451575 length:3459 start_codon:yes stop_codon:yes gene_type:complete
MRSYSNIIDKLKAFSNKYYKKMLLKGVILFLTFGLLFLFVILSLEYFLWLQPTWRLILFVLFIAVELFLLYRYIFVPLLFLFRIKRGITNKEASLLIGKHFPEVGDKLANLLDLANDDKKSELVVASIEQRSKNLNPVPFSNAINFTDNLKYTKYLAIPVVIFLLIWVSGNLSPFFGSANRVVNYKMAYEPPAPFSFQIINESLDILDNQSLTIEAVTIGDVQPEQVIISLDGTDYFMKKENGRYIYSIDPPFSSLDFRLNANGVYSKPYTINVRETPVLEDFTMVLDFPRYLGKAKESVNGTGNATIPEGTKVSWSVSTKNTEKVEFSTRDTILAFDKIQEKFDLSKRIYSNLSYEITSSNRHVANFEKLAYRFTVIKDLSPTISVKEVKDSLDHNVAYYTGEASDDYKLNSIKLVVYPLTNPEKEQVIEVFSGSSGFEQFYYTFPSGLQLEPGADYEYYFTATDNDALRGGKTVKSRLFSMRLLSDDQLRNEDLKAQQSLISNLDRSLEKAKDQKEQLQDINEGQKEKTELNFNDQNQVKDFIRRQEQQEQQMEKFSKKLNDNLNKSDNDDPMKRLLQERLERQELEAKKNQKLLEELDKIASKIKKDELNKRLEDLAKKQQNNERNLEQLVELMKRYYVEEKAKQLAEQLIVEARKQELLSKLNIGDTLSPQEQKKLNENFEKLAEELLEWDKDNAKLKKPYASEKKDSEIESIKKDQNDALDEINKQQGAEQSSSKDKEEESNNKTKQKQKSAAGKMNKMAQSLSQSSMAGGSESSDTEDAEMLRQILDNLVTFSFKQESLYDKLEGTDADNAQFSNSIKEQQGLRDLFEHVDDSIFALSLRRAELSEFVNEQITEVYYNIDKSLESIAENQIYQGASYQKYVLNASNSLADFLAHILDNMQQSMMGGQGEGQGQDKGFQLPDIIQSQQELKEKMEGQGSGEQKGQGNGQGQQQGQGTKGEQGNAAGEKSGGQQSGEAEGEDGQRGSQDGQGNKGKGDGENGVGSGSSEAELQEIYEIYKEQQHIRQRLESQLNDLMNEGDRKLGEKLAKQMEDFENDLLENGITNRGLSKMNNIQHQLLKLENAAMKQGKKPQRESSINKKSYVNPIITKPSFLDNYNNEIEILNRQALPLRQNFQNRVKSYFKGND